MLAWISSIFKPNTSSVNDLEAAFDTKTTTKQPRLGASTSVPAVPFAGRRVNVIIGFFMPKKAHLWWRDLKDFFSGNSQILSISLSRTHQVAAPKSQTPENIQLSTVKNPTDDAMLPPTPPRTPDSYVPTKPFWRLPDLIKYIPYTFHVNPHYQPIAAISEEWFGEHIGHESPRKRQGFEDCNFGLLTAVCYTEANADRFRVLCDFINALFAFDDLTDEGGLRKDSKGTRKASDIVMEALKHPFSYDCEFKCGRIFKDFWGRALEIGCSLGTQRRFMEATEIYLRTLNQQVKHREQGTIPTIDEFIQIRRGTGALDMCFAMGEFGAGVDIPDEVFENPLIKAMEYASNDVVVLANDIYSYNIEQAQGDNFNIIEVSKQTNDFDTQQAIDFATKLVTDRIDHYVACKAKLPSWGQRVDNDVTAYLRVLEDWMVGSFHWSLESKRYFPKNAKIVKQTLVTEIFPRQEARGQQVIPDLKL